MSITVQYNAVQTQELLVFGIEHAIPKQLTQRHELLKKLGEKFDTSRLLAAKDATEYLTEQLSIPLGFTVEALRELALKLNPRIVLPVSETEFFFDKTLLVESIKGYLKSQQELAFLQQSRSVRAADRRYRVQREIASFLEDELTNNPERKEELTKRVNRALGEAHLHIQSDDILAYLESSRINEEKRRLRAQQAETERLAIEELQARG